MRLVRAACAGLPLLFLAVLWPADPGAQSGRAMTIDDLIGAVRVADPQLSPDGRTVVYVRTTTDLKSGTRNADLWIVPAEGGTAKELVGGDKSENTPRWSPNGKQLAFVSTRGGAPQVYVADADGSSVQRITELAMGAQPPLIFSRDATRVAFVSDVYPECADEACNKRRKEEIEKNPVKVRRLTRLLSRHWDEWRENIRHHVMVADLQSKRVVDVTSGDFDSPPGQAEDNAIAFSPDGKELAFVSNRDGNDREAWTTNNDVFLVPVTGGSARKLTQGTGADNQPVFSPDGSTVFVRAQRRGGFESDRWYLDAYDRARGTRRVVFESPDLLRWRLCALGRRQRHLVRRRRTGTREPLYGPGARRHAEAHRRGRCDQRAPLGSGFAVYSKSSMTAPPAKSFASRRPAAARRR